MQRFPNSYLLSPIHKVLYDVRLTKGDTKADVYSVRQRQTQRQRQRHKQEGPFSDSAIQLNVAIFCIQRPAYSSCSMYLCLISFHCFYATMETKTSEQKPRNKESMKTLTPLFQRSQKVSVARFKPTPNANAPPMIVLKNTPAMCNRRVSGRVNVNPRSPTISSAKGVVE